MVNVGDSPFKIKINFKGGLLNVFIKQCSVFYHLIQIETFSSNIRLYDSCKVRSLRAFCYLRSVVYFGLLFMGKQALERS